MCFVADVESPEGCGSTQKRIPVRLEIAVVVAAVAVLEIVVVFVAAEGSLLENLWGSDRKTLRKRRSLQVEVRRGGRKGVGRGGGVWWALPWVWRR